MAISGLQVINIGVQNESIGSDSLYTAFNKVKTNFATLFGNSSPYNTFTGNLGIAVTANSTLGTVDITNTGVLSIIAGTGVTINQANGNVTISSTGGGGGGGGTVTSVGVAAASATRLTVSGSPIVSSGTITMDLATTGVTSGTYTYPTLSVDNYGRILSIANAASVGTVTSVGVTPGAGIQVTGSPVTSSGTMTITNTGVTRLNAGSGISLSGSNGNVTISTATGAGTVTSVSVSSSSLIVTGSPIVNAGTISVDLPSSITVSNSSNIKVTSHLGGTNYVAIGYNANASNSSVSIGESAGADSQGFRSIAIGTQAGSTRQGTGSIAIGYKAGGVDQAANTIAINATGNDLESYAYANATYINPIRNETTNIANPIVYNTTTKELTYSTSLSLAGRFLLNGAEDLVSGSPVSLFVPTTYFSTVTAETGTLATGTEGLIKTFMMVAAGGDMVITVTNAGWKTSGTGTMTFDTIGDGCTLQYINNKWYCIGNNGVVFA